MNARALLASACVLLPASLALAPKAQDGSSETPLQRVEPTQPAPGQELRADEWKHLLGESDLDRREAEYDRLVERALDDPEVLDELRERARGSDDLAWTARLALREVELRRSPFAGWWEPGDLDGFLSDALPPLRRSGSGMIRGLEDRLNRLLEDHGKSRSVQRSESYRIESTPDGVRVEVREKKDGKEEVKTYEGKSLEELYAQYPDLRGQLGLADPKDGGLGPELEALRDTLRESFPGLTTRIGQVPVDRLGVLMREPGQWSASVDGVEPGTGLYVERVFPGTLAEALGLRSGDILLSLNGKTLRNAADVRSVLQSRKPDGAVHARVIDRRGRQRELAWTPPARETR